MPQLFVHNVTDIIHGGAEHDRAMTLPRNFRAETVTLELVRQVTNGFPPGTAHWNGGDPRVAAAGEIDAHRAAIEQDKIADRKADFKRLLTHPASPHRFVVEALVRLVNQHTGATISRADVRTMFESLIDSADDVPPKERS